MSDKRLGLRAGDPDVTPTATGPFLAGAVFEYSDDGVWGHAKRWAGVGKLVE